MKTFWWPCVAASFRFWPDNNTVFTLFVYAVYTCIITKMYIKCLIFSFCSPRNVELGLRWRKTGSAHNEVHDRTKAVT